MTASSPLEHALEALPHGPEFRFVDRLTALEPGRSGTGEYRVRGDESFLAGHFPGDPLFPGVLLVEAIAQMAGVVAQSDPQQPPLSNLKLTAIRSAKILGTGRPGDLLQLKVEITGRLENLLQARGAASLNDRPLLQADVVLSGDPSAPAD
jgi:3-hydroxyacyl-[acyl-carrier-protein] dehydratase